MSDFMKAYYEAKVLSSMGMFKGDPVKYADSKVKEKPKEEKETNKEIENHTVIGNCWNDDHYKG